MIKLDHTLSVIHIVFIRDIIMYSAIAGRNKMLLSTVPLDPYFKNLSKLINQLAFDLL